MRWQWKAMLAVLLICLLVVSGVAATSTTNITSYRAVTLKGPSGLLVPLGIENYMPLDEALVWYNWICFAIIFPFACAAGSRETRFFVIAIPIITAIFAWWGWFNTPDPATTYGLIIVSALMGVGLYMKGALRENWGLGGPGSTLINLVVYIIILQAVIGFVNTSTIWNENTGIANEDYSNVDLSEQTEGLISEGGVLNTLINTATILYNIAFSAIRVLVSIIASIALFSVVLLLAFPFLNTPIALAFLTVLQVGNWVLLGKFMSDYFYMKTIGTTDL